MTLPNGFVELGEQTQAGARDARCDAATILRLTLAGDQPARFEPIQQPRDVRVFCHHPLAYFATGGALFTSAAQDSQRVVLRLRQISLLERLVNARRQPLGGAQEAEVDLFLAASERPGRLRIFMRFCNHANYITCYDDYCQGEI